MTETIEGWNAPDLARRQREGDSSKSSNNYRQQSSKVSEVQAKESPNQADIWFNDHLFNFDTTSNLDSQHPATLYYMGRVIDIPKINSVYVEKREDGCRKHWAVLSERDYDMMDRTYDIERETHNRFPMADLNFRVTVDSEDGPSVSKGAIKIYDRK